ncbi:hypothetical protein BJX96DRAFT_83143 [Aspergillus floccosus]
MALVGKQRNFRPWKGPAHLKLARCPGNSFRPRHPTSIPSMTRIRPSSCARGFEPYHKYSSYDDTGLVVQTMAAYLLCLDRVSTT